MTNHTNYPAGNADYAATPMVVTMPIGKSRVMTACRAYVPAEHVLTWDAPAENTTHAIFVADLGIRVYVEVKVTGRRERSINGIWGIAARVRFTGPDSSEEAYAAVVSFPEDLAA